jgi:iron complex outermembrane receptor protein
MEIWGAGALKFHPGSFLSSALHVQAGRETFREENHYEETSPSRPNAQRYSAIATLSGEMKLLPARLLAHGAYTYDRRMSKSDYQDFNLSWRRVSDAYVSGDHHNFNAGLRFDPSAAHQIKLNAGYYTRVPDFGELFGNNAFSAGNCELLPEKGVNSDVTFISRFSLPHLSGARHSLSVFLNHINDQIVYRMFNRIVKPENMGDVRIVGAEQDVEAAWRGLKVRNQAAFMRSEIIRAPIDSLYLNRERAYLPAFKNTLLLELRLSGWMEAGYGLNARSGYFTSEYNLARVPPAVTHDAMARIAAPGLGLKLTVEIKNMTDEKSCDVEAFPLPGRAFYLTLAYQSTH